MRIIMTKIKTALLGYGRGGKDTLVEHLRDQYDHRYIATSLLIAEIVTYPVMKDTHGYKSVEECYEDRHNHRPLIKSLISEYNKEDKARLVKEVLAVNDFYVGLRCKEELDECKRQGLFDYICWVDRDGCFEDKSSCTVDRTMADYFIDNNGTLEDLKEVGAGFVNHIMSKTEQRYGFSTDNSIDHGKFLQSKQWDDMNETRPAELGTYTCLCHDIVNSWLEELYWDGNTWLTKMNGKLYECLVDKFKYKKMKIR